ncbi:hypothetical protein ACLK1T_12525 [Escherichia coli]
MNALLEGNQQNHSHPGSLSERDQWCEDRLKSRFGWGLTWLSHRQSWKPVWRS